MFINLLKSSLLVVSLLAVCFVAQGSAAEKGIVALDVKGSKLHFGGSGEPTICKSTAQLIRALGKDVAKRIQSKVDLKTQDVLVFRWSNSGSDKFEIVKPKKPGEPWIFTLTKGITEADIPDIRAFAVPHGISWQFKAVSRDNERIPVPVK